MKYFMQSMNSLPPTLNKRTTLNKLLIVKAGVFIPIL